MILVTGGAGFIGSNFVINWLRASDEPVINVDALTYAGNLTNLRSLDGHSGHIFVHGDIRDRPTMDRALHERRPRAIVHFAAESHVDRSIHGPAAFMQTNVIGTFTLLEATRQYLSSLTSEERTAFRFIHVSTDEIYGSLSATEAPFSEAHPHRPNSPYAASKAASDHLVRAWHQTYGVPVITTNCSNNYGPYQFPEKLIPLIIVNAIVGKPLPVYGDGLQVRDWLYVDDHCAAIRRVLSHGRVGETYNIGGSNEKTNIEIVRLVCSFLDQLRPDAAGHYARLITFVDDRPGHDRRYAIDAGKLMRELNWYPADTFHSGIQKTVRWYLQNLDWVSSVVSGNYREWVTLNYAARSSN